MLLRKKYEMRRKMKVLVTGATGFIGSNLVRRLASEGYEVSVLVRSRGMRNLPAKVKVIKGDLTLSPTLKGVAKGRDVVFNLAAGLPHHHLTDDDYIEINVNGLKNLLEECVREKVKRFIHVSTVGIYGTG